MAYWLLKSEPSTYSFDDLERDETTCWEGVRNYQARNFMREMCVGDQAFFYHSSCDTPGIVGIAVISRSAYPDHTAWDKRSKYFDARCDPDDPRWDMVDVSFKRRLKRLIALGELKACKELADFSLVKKGNRLSVMPVSKKQWSLIVKRAQKAS